MAKCEWCKEQSNSLNTYSDAIGDEYKICDKCKQVADTLRCRKCDKKIDPMTTIKGLCSKCVQVEIHEKVKKREEIRLGVNNEMCEPLVSELMLSDEDYERWLTMGKAYTPEDLKKSRELRYIWIMVKLNSVGIYDNDTIKDNFNDIEELFDRNFSKLIGNKCKLIIGDKSEYRNIIRTSEAIDSLHKVYILKA